MIYRYCVDVSSRVILWIRARCVFGGNLIAVEPNAAIELAIKEKL